MQRNYYKLMEAELKELAGRPKLLLHSCCGPCSSSVTELLAKYFELTVFYSNSNIYPQEEYEKRLANQQRLLDKMFPDGQVQLLSPDYDHGNFTERIENLEADIKSQPEGGVRCEICFEMRLGQTACAAKEGRFDYFTTTLSVSPHKSAEAINRIGLDLAEEYGVKFLTSDFKKKDGYKRSIELSGEYGIYRQNYCGCEFSINS